MYTLRTACCILLIHLTLDYASSNTTPRKAYLSTSDNICAGTSYTLGCGYADGSQVMNVTKISIYLDTPDQAMICRRRRGGHGVCVEEKERVDDKYNDVGLRNLYKFIVHNCQGKPKCEGTLPEIDDLKVNFLEGYDNTFACFDILNLDFVIITTKCVAPGAVPILPAFTFQPPKTTTTPTSTNSTTNTTTATNTTASSTSTESMVKTTTIPKSSMKTTTTDKLILSTTAGKGVKEPVKRLLSISEMSVAFIVLGCVAALAAVIGLVITLYVLCSKSSSRAITRTSQSEYPLNDHEKYEIADNGNTDPPKYSEYHQ